MSENQSTLVKTARATGFWYLMLAITGILGFMVFHSKIYISGNPGQTLENLSGQETLARVRLLFELLIVLSQALAAVYFYKLFRGINDWEAWALGVWGTVNAGVILVSAIAMAAAIQIANSEVQAFDDQVASIDLLSSLIKHAWNVGGLFFGLWLLPMGHIVVTSKRFPVWLGWTLIAGGVGYILQTFIYYAGLKPPFMSVLTIPATVGEFWMIGYLLIFGIRPLKETKE